MMEVENRGVPEIMQRNTNEGRFWTTEEYRELIYCYLFCEEYFSTNYREVYDMWRNRNPNTRPHIDAKKLLNQKNYIIRNNKITQCEISEMKTQILRERNHARSEVHVQNSIEIERDTNDHVVNAQFEERNYETMTIPAVDSTTILSNTAELLKHEIEIKFYEVSQLNLAQRRRLERPNDMHQAKELIKIANEALENIISHTQLDITQLNNLIYAAVCVIVNRINGEEHVNHTRNSNHLPLWKKRINIKIQEFRKDLSMLVELKNGYMRRGSAKSRNLLSQYRINIDGELNVAIETLKQKILAQTQRINRYDKRIEQYKINRLFKTDSRKLYRILRNENKNVERIPDRVEIEQFWKNIYENEVIHNTEAIWINKYESNNVSMDWSAFTINDLTAVLKSTANWKTPGPDQIQNYWLKSFTSLHLQLVVQFNKMVDNEENVPDWLLEGSTILVYKTGDSKDPKNYRPITCLNNIYKLYTSLLCEKMMAFIEQNGIIPVEQKGCCRNSAGCKDQLLISKVLFKDCRSRKKNMCLAWIDYKKAFDSVPHSWILKAMELIGIHQKIRNACESMMKRWTTKINIRSKDSEIVTDYIRVKRGIFQGDSLSPLLFCISLIFLSHEINNTNAGYTVNGITEKVTHLLYMDDLKLTCKNEAELKLQLQKVKRFSDDIKMDFGLDKCALAVFKRGKLVKKENLIIDSETEIKQLEENGTYRYLGVEESNDIQHTKMKEIIKKEYYARIRKILRSQLNGKNKMSAIGVLAVPVIQYSFGVIDWRLDEIRKIDVKTRKLLTMHQIHHPRGDVDRLYVSRKLGGRGLRQVEGAYKCSIIGLQAYIEEFSQYDKHIKMIKIFDTTQAQINSIKSLARKYVNEFDLQNYGILDRRNKKCKIKEAVSKKLYNTWKHKPMHGQHPRNMESQLVDKEKSYLWLTQGDLKGETESSLVAAQDQAYTTNYQMVRILQTATDPLCRLCHQNLETVTHIISACPILARNEYIYRHDRVCTQIHFNICKCLKIPLNTDRWYEHIPKTVDETSDGNITVLWNSGIHTDRTISCNRPDIIIRDNIEKNCWLIDVAIPADDNITKKEAEKILKYRDLAIEIQRMWKTKVKIIPIVIGATGTISRAFNKYLSDVPGIHSTKEVQKTAILGTSTILRKCFS